MKIRSFIAKSIAITESTGCLIYQDTEKGQICNLTLNKLGAKITTPPRGNAKTRQHGNRKGPPLARDEVIRAMRKLGLAEWKRQSCYHRRSIAETTMFRFKQIFGDNLRAILFESQAVEAFIKCNALNKMTSLGMPDSYTVA
jgi:hypothetical protein